MRSSRRTREARVVVLGMSGVASCSQLSYLQQMSGLPPVRGSRYSFSREASKQRKRHMKGTLSFRELF